MILQPACGLGDEDISDGPRTGFAFFSKFRREWTGGHGHESVCRPSDSQLMGDAWDDGCWHVVIRLKGLAPGKGSCAVYEEKQAANTEIGKSRIRRSL